MDVVAASALALLLTLAFAGAGHGTARSQRPVALMVIAHGGVPEARLDADALRAVFLRKRTRWSDKQAVIPINYPAGDPTRTAFDAAVLGFNGAETARYWIDERIRHGTEAPMSIPSPALLVRVVRQLAGSVGYLPEAPPPPGVRVMARVHGDQVLPP